MRIIAYIRNIGLILVYFEGLSVQAMVVSDFLLLISTEPRLES